MNTEALKVELLKSLVSKIDALLQLRTDDHKAMLVLKKDNRALKLMVKNLSKKIK